MKRQKHSLSHYVLASFDMGELVPVGLLDALPGDTFRMSSSALLRASPLMRPVMHPVSIRLHHWFIPFRLLWDGWEDFITGGEDGEGGSSGAFPTIDTGAGLTAGELGDYFGIPPGVAAGSVSALPFRAYALVFNEMYRDQDLVSKLAMVTTSGADATTNKDLARIAWEKDYFTAARLYPQKGPQVVMPLGTTAPVDLSSTTGVTPLIRLAATHALPGSNVALQGQTGTGVFESTGGTDLVFDPNNTLIADLSAATGVDVNTVRLAFAVQRFQERMSLFGSRYSEYLRFLGITPQDSRLQRPEYIGGGKQTFAWSEVLQTGVTTDGDDTEGVGNLKGHGIAAMRSRRVDYFVQEHGFIMSLMSVRPRSMYASGVHRSWYKTAKEDYWQRELEDVGQQEIYNREVRCNHASPSGVFGYGDRYSEYRHQPSRIAADFRTTLDDFHLARIFSSDPSLNAAFVECEPAKRIFAEQTADSLWAMINHSVQARRLVKRTGIGRIY